MKMCLREYSAKDVPKLARQLRHTAPTLSPLSLWLLRRAHAGRERTLAQASLVRAELAASLEQLFATQGTRLLYQREAWVRWLLALDVQMLAALYFTFLLHGFQ